MTVVKLDTIFGGCNNSISRKRRLAYNVDLVSYYTTLHFYLTLHPPPRHLLLSETFEDNNHKYRFVDPHDRHTFTMELL